MKINGPKLGERLLLAYFIYYVFVGTIVTFTIDHYAGKIYQQQTGRVLSYSWAGMNPLTLSVYIHDASDMNPDGSILWSVDELVINPSFWGTLFSKGFVLDGIKIDSFYIHALKLQDGNWAFADILQHREQMPKSEADEKKSESEAELPGITISEIDFNAKFLGYSDWSREEPFDGSLEDISILLTDFSTLVEEGQPYHFVASDESGGELEWRGTVSLLGATSSGRLDLRDISLLPAYRYIKSDVNFELHSALLGAGGDYELSWADPANIEFAINNGSVSLGDIDLTPDDDETSRISLNRFAIENIAIDSNARTIYSPQGSLYGFGGTVSILEDGTTNFNQMFAVKELQSSAQTPETKMTDEADGEGEGDAAPWSVQLDVINISNTGFYFNDHSIDPDFKVFVKDFGGQVTNITTAEGEETIFDLSGTVDDYAPVTLIGKVKPSASPALAEAAFDFKGIDLTSFSPYSGTFAGRKISKGLLTVSLDYELKGGLIDGKNQVVIDQMTLGERVDSPRILDLPLQLGLALLTDKNGVIDLKVDVSGNADDPDFSVSRILFGAFKNLIIKAITSPFQFLASLIGSDEDFEFIGFAVAAAELQPANFDQLNKLAEVLTERPRIKIGLVGLYGKKDIDYYRTLTLLTQSKMDHLKPIDLENRNERFQKAVTRQFKKSFPDKELMSVDEMFAALLEAEPFPELEIQQLRQNRALAVKQYLLNQAQLDPQRVFIQLESLEDKAEAVKLIADVAG